MCPVEKTAVYVLPIATKLMGRVKTLFCSLELFFFVLKSIDVKQQYEIKNSGDWYVTMHSTIVHFPRIFSAGTGDGSNYLPIAKKHISSLAAVHSFTFHAIAEVLNQDYVLKCLVICLEIFLQVLPSVISCYCFIS